MFNKYLEFFKKNLHGHTEFQIWQIILIGTFFFICDIVIFLAFWYAREGNALEYGYPKRKPKYIRQLKKSYTIVQRLFLVRITFNADRQGIFLYLNLFCHFINIFSLLASVIGYVGCLVTHADNLFLLLLIFVEISHLFITTAIMFIPDLICLPSERDRYRITKRKRKR